MIKAVIFDIDGVLLDSFKANLKFFQELLLKAGYTPPSKEQYLPLFHLSMWDIIKTFSGLTDDKEIEKVWEMGRGGQVKYPSHLIITTKNVEKTLKVLSAEYTLGIVTSRVREGVYKIPALAKLKKYFKATVSFQDTINHKPHPDPLLLVCKMLKVNPKDAVYVGDAENDLIAGKAAGMKIIYFSKSTNKNADAATSKFEKIPGIIKSLIK